MTQSRPPPGRRRAPHDPHAFAAITRIRAEETLLQRSWAVNTTPIAAAPRDCFPGFTSGQAPGSREIAPETGRAQTKKAVITFRFGGKGPKLAKIMVSQKHQDHEEQEQGSNCPKSSSRVGPQI
jgi:hypothetical protein